MEDGRPARPGGFRKAARKILNPAEAGLRMMLTLF
jgi:hypothetical protein